MNEKNIPIKETGRTILKVIPSAIPIWTASAVWITGALLLPMYKLPVLIVTALISAAAGLIVKKVLPKETRTIELPFRSGDERVDHAINSLDEAQKRLTENAALIIRDYPETGRTLNETASTLSCIREELVKDSGCLKKLRRFFDYYLPTQLKLADKYVEMINTKKAGEYSMNTFLSAEKALVQLNASFRKQYDALFEDDSLDVETDIAVLDTMLKQDNLK